MIGHSANPSVPWSSIAELVHRLLGIRLMASGISLCGNMTVTWDGGTQISLLEYLIEYLSGLTPILDGSDTISGLINQYD
jgi:hypothetical protein